MANTIIRCFRHHGLIIEVESKGKANTWMFPTEEVTLQEIIIKAAELRKLHG